MWNGSSYSKRIAIIVIIIFILSLNFLKIPLNTKCVAYAEKSTEEQLNDKTNEILNDIDSDDLDEFILNDYNIAYFDGFSFKDLVKEVLNGNFFLDYSSLFDWIKSNVYDVLKSVLSILIVLFVLVVISELFKSLCSDKYADIKKIVKIIFSLVIVLLVAILFKDLAENVSSSVGKIFSFIKILFPILLSLILLSGANTSFSIYSSLSVFVLNTVSYLYEFVLMPIAISIFVLSLFGCVFQNDRFSKVIDLLKTIFKYIIAGVFAIFGMLSGVNLISGGIKDGVGLKLTKYAIKNYVPVLGGYISDGFDFVHSCSVLVKNAFGVCGLYLILFIILKPLLLYVVYMFSFKILSVVVSYIGEKYYSDIFENVSKSISYFIAVLVGLFLILFLFLVLMIVSVSVVWWWFIDLFQWLLLWMFYMNWLNLFFLQKIWKQLWSHLRWYFFCMLYVN